MSSHFSLRPVLAKLAEGGSLGEQDAHAAFELIMSGGAPTAQIGAFLMGLRIKGETVEEITALARVVRARARPVPSPPGTIDTCGTGGDGIDSLNVSTAVALVVAACGVPVAKHGNRAVSSSSGSADVLAALGVDITADDEKLRRCLWQNNICFMLATQHHLAMRHVAAARQELGIRTVFNLLGPLANPAGARIQLLGVYAERWVRPLADVLGRLGSQRAWVVHGNDGLDELTVTGPSTVASWDQGRVSCFQITPEQAGLPRWPLDSFRGGDAAFNAAALRRLLQGETGAYRDIVLLNAAAALIIAEQADSLVDGVCRAAAAIDRGDAQARLAELVAMTNQPTLP